VGWPKGLCPGPNHCKCPTVAESVRRHVTPAVWRQYETRAPRPRWWLRIVLTFVGAGLLGWAGVPGMGWAGWALGYAVGVLGGAFLALVITGVGKSRP
jgi:hypothetical protein